MCLSQQIYSQTNLRAHHLMIHQYMFDGMKFDLRPEAVVCTHTNDTRFLLSTKVNFFFLQDDEDVIEKKNELWMMVMVLRTNLRRCLLFASKRGS